MTATPNKIFICTEKSRINDCGFGATFYNMTQLPKPNDISCSDDTPETFEFIYHSPDITLTFNKGVFDFANAEVKESIVSIDGTELPHCPSVKEVETVLGEPEDRAEENDDLFLVYKRNDLFIEFEFSEQGILSQVYVSYSPCGMKK